MISSKVNLIQPLCSIWYYAPGQLQHNLQLFLNSYYFLASSTSSFSMTHYLNICIFAFLFSFSFLTPCTHLCNKNHSVALRTVSKLVPSACLQFCPSPWASGPCRQLLHRHVNPTCQKLTTPESVPFVGCFILMTKSPKVKPASHSRLLLPHSSHPISFTISLIRVL